MTGLDPWAMLAAPDVLSAPAGAVLVAWEPVGGKLRLRTVCAHACSEMFIPSPPPRPLTEAARVLATLHVLDTACPCGEALRLGAQRRLHVRLAGPGAGGASAADGDTDCHAVTPQTAAKGE